jgi:protocatechuate 3,4-dioxygenase beta subunit
MTGSLVVTKAGFVRTETVLPAATPSGADPLVIHLTRAAAISGRVIDDFGDPIVGVTVIATIPEKPDALPQGMPRSVTDDRGAYRIAGLAPKSYIVLVRTADTEIHAEPRNGGTAFGPTSYTTYFPDTEDPSMAVPVTVAAGDDRYEVDFHVPFSHARMQAYGVLTPISLRDMSIRSDGTAVVRGTVRSTDGRLLPHAQVTISRTASLNFRRATTDENGAFEFSALPADTYRIAASKPGFALPSPPAPGIYASADVEVTVADRDVRERVDVTLRPWGSITGHVLDEAGEPVQGALVGLQVARYERGRRRLVVASQTPQRLTDDHGEFRIFAVPPGQYIVGASVSDAPDAWLNDIGGYGPSYFPGTGAATEARFVTVDAGEDLKGLDFGLVTAATGRVSGTVVNASGQPLTSGRFNLVSRSANSTRLDSRRNSDGTFTFQNVPPGQYVIQADQGRLNGFTEGEFGAFPITVGQFDVTGLRLQTSMGSTITGHFTFDSFSGAAAPAPTAIAVSPVPVDFDLAPPAIAETSGNAEGVFHLEGITGLRRLQVTRTPPGWMAKSILVNGRDVTDQILDFGRQDDSLEDVEIVLTDRINQVTGMVSDGQARPVSGARVVLFSADRERWYPSSRFIRSAVTAADGSFAIAGPPTGSYFVAPALRTPVGDNAWEDPQFLESLRPAATAVTVGDAQTQVINLRMPTR